MSDVTIGAGISAGEGSPQAVVNRPLDAMHERGADSQSPAPRQGTGAEPTAAVREQGEEKIWFSSATSREGVEDTRESEEIAT